MRRPWLVVVVLLHVVLLALVGLLARHGDDGDESAPAAPGVDVPSSGHAEAALVEAPSPAPDSPAAQRDAARPERGAPLDVAAFDAQPRDPRVAVRVVDGRDETPCPGADLWVLDASAFEAFAGDRVGALGADLGAQLAREGEHHPAGADGVARVPDPPHGALLHARHGERSGYAEIGDRTGAAVTLRVWPVSVLAARVVDAAGNAIEGVEVAVQVASDPDRRGPSTRMHAPTDPTGLVRFVDPEAALGAASSAISTGLGGAVSLAVIAPFPEAAVAEVAVDLTALPERPFELVLPAHGAVEVTLEGADGGPPFGEWFVVLRPTPSGAFGRTTPATVARPDADGVARFEHVGVGQRLIGYAMTDGGLQDDQPDLIELDGPSLAGERVAVTIPVDDAGWLLTGRLVTPEGAPIEPQRLHALLLWAGGRSVPGVRDLPVTGDGLIELFVDGSLADAVGGGRLELRPLRHAGRAYVGAFEFERPAGARVVDLGDAALEALPPLARGRVVDGDGRPVGRATIGLHEWNGVRWAAVGGSFLGWSDADGVFTLDGRPPDRDGPFAASARTDTHFQPEPVPFEPGTTDLLLAVEPYGAVAGRIAWDGDPRALEVGVEDARGREVRRVRVESDGRFLAGRLRPGAYAVRALLRGGTPVGDVAVEGVAVAGGAPTRDPRLDPLDLRDALALLRVTVEDEGGERVREGFATVTVPGTGESERAPLEYGRATFGVPPVPVDVAVEAAGCDPGGVEDAQGDVTVTLARTRRLLAEPPPGLVAPEGTRFEVSIAPADHRGGADVAGVGSEPFELRVEAPGEYRVRWYVALLEPPAGRAVRPRVVRAEPQRVVVEDRRGTQTVVLVAPPAPLVDDAAAAVRADASDG